MWTEVEILVGLFCASAPALKALILRYSPKFLGTALSSRTRELNEQTMRTFGFSANKSFDGEEGIQSFNMDDLELGTRYDSEIRKSQTTRDSLQQFDFGFESHHDFDIVRPPSYQQLPPHYASTNA
jgi:hypothetical protein